MPPLLLPLLLLLPPSPLWSVAVAGLGDVFAAANEDMEGGSIDRRGRRETEADYNDDFNVSWYDDVYMVML